MRAILDRRHIILGLLFMAKSIPLVFFTMGLPVILRLEGLPLETIGFLQLTGLPYLLKFLWAPLLDRNGRQASHYKVWILGTGLASTLLFTILSGQNPQAHIWDIGLCILASSAVVSTQDIAINALYIKLLAFEERGAGSSTKVAALNLGSILGSGAFLLLYNHTGWQATLLIMAGTAILPLLLLPLLNEEECPQMPQNSGQWLAIPGFFRTRGMTPWFTLTVCNSIGISAVFFLIKPFLIDCGVPADTAAFLVGFYGMGIAALTAMLTGGIHFQHFLLNRRRAYLGGVLICALAAGLFIPAALFPQAHAPLYAAIAMLNIALTIHTVVSATLIMDFSRQGNESLDYSLQMTGIHLGGMAMASFSGVVAARTGYLLFFVLQTGISLVMFFVSMALFKESWITKKSDPAVDGHGTTRRTA